MSAETGNPWPGGHAEFTATHWTQVALAADQEGSAPARQALEALCARYWPPIYGFLRRKNYPAADAADLAQGFFSHLLEENAFSRADRSKGRFRSFLLGALQRYLVDERRRARAQKRGHDKIVLVHDLSAAEERYLEEADPGLTPEEVFDRRWATTVLESAFAELREEFTRAGQAARFEVLKRFLSEDPGEGDYAAAAERLGVGIKAVSSAVFRLRERFREWVLRHVRATVDGPEGIDPEFRELFQ